MASRFVVLLLVLLPLTTRATDGEGLVNKVVATTLDLTTHIAKMTVAVTLENNGDKAVTHVQYLLDPLLADKLAYINAEVSYEVVHHVYLVLSLQSEDKPLVVSDHVASTGKYDLICE